MSELSHLFVCVGKPQGEGRDLKMTLSNKNTGKEVQVNFLDTIFLVRNWMTYTNDSPGTIREEICSLSDSVREIFGDLADKVEAKGESLGSEYMEAQNAEFGKAFQALQM